MSKAVLKAVLKASIILHKLNYTDFPNISKLIKTIYVSMDIEDKMLFLIAHTSITNTQLHN